MALTLPATRSGTALTTPDALRLLHRAAPQAVGAAAVALALVAAGLVLTLSPGRDARAFEQMAVVGLGLAVAACASLGALVLAAQPRQRFGLALLVGGVLGAIWTFAMAWSGAGDAGRPLREWSAWLENWTFVGLIVLVTWPLLLFPDGRLPSRRWRPVAILLLAAQIGVATAGMLDPGMLDGVDGEAVASPLGLSGGWAWTQALSAAGFGIPVGVVAGMVAVQRRAAARREPAYRWALWASRALAANFVLCLALNVMESPLADGAFYAATLTTSTGLFAAAATIAVLRYRSLEVDLLLRRAFIVAGVALGGLLAFVAAFAITSVVAGHELGTLAGGISVAAVAVPLRIRVRDTVDRALYGHRDVAGVFQRFERAVTHGGEPATTLASVAEAVREAFAASAAVVSPAADVELAAQRSGAALLEPCLGRTLEHRGRVIGRLEVGARAPGEPYGAADVALLDLLGGQVALVVDALVTATALQHSREALVATREEERRRLRRELHDGVGPALAGIALTLQAARNVSDAAGGRLIDDAREQTEAALSDVRRMARGLRPPALEDLGLSGALRAYADRLRPLHATLDVDEPSAPLPAAVELAVYRIVTEALTNVVRHAGARRCDVVVRVAGPDVHVSVDDDGTGLRPTAEPGVGLRSIGERVAELGGELELGTGVAGGMSLEVRLPLGGAT